MIRAEIIEKDEKGNAINVVIDATTEEIMCEWEAVCEGCIRTLAEDMEEDDLKVLVSLILAHSLEHIKGAYHDTEQTDLC